MWCDRWLVFCGVSSVYSCVGVCVYWIGCLSYVVFWWFLGWCFRLFGCWIVVVLMCICCCLLLGWWFLSWVCCVICRIGSFLCYMLVWSGWCWYWCWWLCSCLGRWVRCDCSLCLFWWVDGGSVCLRVLCFCMWLVLCFWVFSFVGRFWCVFWWWLVGCVVCWLVCIWFLGVGLVFGWRGLFMVWWFRLWFSLIWFWVCWCLCGRCLLVCWYW